MYIIAMAKVFHQEIPWKKILNADPLPVLTMIEGCKLLTYLPTYSMEQSPS